VEAADSEGCRDSLYGIGFWLTVMRAPGCELADCGLFDADVEVISFASMHYYTTFIPAISLNASAATTSFRLARLPLSTFSMKASPAL
jgi:hypothetical protein